MHCKKKYFSRLLIVNFPFQTQRIIFDIYNWLQFLVILRRKSISMENNIFLYLYTNAQMTDLDWLWLLIFNEQWAAYISFAPSYIRKFMLRIFGYWHIGSKVASTNSTESPSNIEGVTGFSVMLQNLDLYTYIFQNRIVPCVFHDLSTNSLSTPFWFFRNNSQVYNNAQIGF